MLSQFWICGKLHKPSSCLIAQVLPVTEYDKILKMNEKEGFKERLKKRLQNLSTLVAKAKMAKQEDKLKGIRKELNT